MMGVVGGMVWLLMVGWWDGDIGVAVGWLGLKVKCALLRFVLGLVVNNWWVFTWGCSHGVCVHMGCSHGVCVHMGVFIWGVFTWGVFTWGCSHGCVFTWGCGHMGCCLIQMKSKIEKLLEAENSRLYHKVRQLEAMYPVMFTVYKSKGSFRSAVNVWL